MSSLLEWLSSYGAEYNASTKVLLIRRPIYVGDFVFLKKILNEKCKGKISDIKVGL